MSRGIKWEELKTTDPVETMNIFSDLNEDYIVPGI